MPEITIARNFSRAATNYDDHARVQALVARDLLEFFQYDAPNSILELGCGTGLYTRMLLDSFPNASLKAIDISDAMIEVAQQQIDCSRASFLCADAETFTAGKHEMITSNASFHWFRDPQRTIDNLYGMLNDGGWLTFSYFGPNTYCELQQSLARVAGTSSKLACSSFLTLEEVRYLLSTVFRVVEIEEREYTETFVSVRNLLENIKLTGTRGAGSNSRIIWTSGLLRSLEAAYMDYFGCIRATYQVYMCRAEK